jgi:hypothetical protein
MPVTPNSLSAFGGNPPPEIIKILPKDNFPVSGHIEGHVKTRAIKTKVVHFHVAN